MAFVNHLKSEEISYEIRLRGKRPGATQGERRRQLRSLVAYKAEVDISVESPVPIADDLQQIENSLTDLSQVLSTFSGKVKNEVLRLTFRFNHVRSRIDRVSPEEETDKERLAKLGDLFDQLHGQFLFKLDEVSGAEAVGLPTPAIAPTSRLHVPVRKWDVQFSGDSKVSLVSFIERVKELKEARGVSNEELFVSAVDLFTGPALMWYRSIKDSVHSWDELEGLMKTVFLPRDYDEHLLDEIKRRTQGEHEKVTLFISTMRGLFKKLSSVPVEADQLKFIRRNLCPYFANHLALQKIASVDELLDLCRNLEEVKLSVDKYRPPPSRKHDLLEPELAYLSNQDLAAPMSVVSELSRTTCWNCRQCGHVYSNCTNSRRKFCFGCGFPNVTKVTCPKCTKNVRKGVTLSAGTPPLQKQHSNGSQKAQIYVPQGTKGKSPAK